MNADSTSDLMSNLDLVGYILIKTQTLMLVHVDVIECFAKSLCVPIKHNCVVCLALNAIYTLCSTTSMCGSAHRWHADIKFYKLAAKYTHITFYHNSSRRFESTT